MLLRLTSHRVIRSAPNTCPHGSSVYVLGLDYNLCCVAYNLHQISTGNISSVSLWWKRYRPKYTHINTHLHKHLVLTDPAAHLGLLESEEPALPPPPPPLRATWAAAVVWVLAVDPRCCSKRCQSVSALLHGWERQDSRADFSVFFYTGEGDACQHTSAQRHLKAVDSFFITASRTACFGKDMFCVCLHLQEWRTGCYQRWQIQIDDVGF